MLDAEWNDERLQRAITGSNEDRKRALRHIFSHLDWRKVALKYVIAKGGNQQDGEDAFQEAVILFDRNLREKRFKGESTLRTYFVSIVKWYWWGQIRKRRPQEELLDQRVEDFTESADFALLSKEKKHYLQEAVRRLGARCQHILELYKLHYSMQEIATEVGLSSPAMAKKEAYGCRKKLKAFFVKHPHWKNLVK